MCSSTTLFLSANHAVQKSFLADSVSESLGNSLTRCSGRTPFRSLPHWGDLCCFPSQGRFWATFLFLFRDDTGACLTHMVLIWPHS